MPPNVAGQPGLKSNRSLIAVGHAVQRAARARRSASCAPRPAPRRTPGRTNALRLGLRASIPRSVASITSTGETSRSRMRRASCVADVRTPRSLAQCRWKVGAGVLVRDRSRRRDLRWFRTRSSSATGCRRRAMAPTDPARGETVNLNRGGRASTSATSSIFHPPPGAVDRQVRRPSRSADQACARPTSQMSSVLFIKRIVAGPGDGVRVPGRSHDPQRQAADGSRTSPPARTRGVRPPAARPPSPTACTSCSATTAARQTTAASGAPCPRACILGRAERCKALYFACSPVR